MQPRLSSDEMATLPLIIDTAEFPALEGQEIGRELELEMTAVVTKVIPWEFGTPLSEEGGSPSHVVLAIMRVDITQTT